MTHNQHLFALLLRTQSGTTTFGDRVGKIIGISNIGKSPPTLEDALLIDGLKANLISVSQFVTEI